MRKKIDSEKSKERGLNMNIIDKRPEREQERKEEIARKQEAYKKELEAKNAVIPEIKLMSDWRVEQEYNMAMEPNRLFVHERRQAKEKFLEDAVKNRHQLKRLIVEDYQFDPFFAARHDFSIETDEETLETLTKEACKLNLSLEAYIRAIFYTAAFEINEAKRKREEEAKKLMEENAIVELGNGRKIEPELRRKLEGKFGKPKSNSYTVTYNYTDMLLDLAKEYFEI